MLVFRAGCFCVCDWYITVAPHRPVITGHSRSTQPCHDGGLWSGLTINKHQPLLTTNYNHHNLESSADVETTSYFTYYLRQLSLVSLISLWRSEKTKMIFYLFSVDNFWPPHYTLCPPVSVLPEENNFMEFPLAHFSRHCNGDNGLQILSFIPVTREFNKLLQNSFTPYNIKKLISVSRSWDEPPCDSWFIWSLWLIS